MRRCHTRRGLQQPAQIPELAQTDVGQVDDVDGFVDGVAAAGFDPRGVREARA